MVYAGGKQKRNKYDKFVRLFGLDAGSLATIDHDLHRIRRSPLSPFFSKANVRKLEPIIQKRAQRVLSRMRKLENTGLPLNIFYLFSAFTSDVIMEYCFGEAPDYLEMEDLNEDFYHMMDSMHHIGPVARQFGWLLPVLLSIPSTYSRTAPSPFGIFCFIL